MRLGKSHLPHRLTQPGSKLEVIALDRSNGRIVWRQSVTASQLEQPHAISNPASTTAAADGKRVYAYLGSYGLVAYEWDGKLAWETRLPHIDSDVWNGNLTCKAPIEAFRLGFDHGLFCVGCCRSLMLLIFVVGSGSLGWMLLLGAVMAAEKNLPWGRKLSAPLGVVLLVSSILVVVVRPGGS